MRPDSAQRGRLEEIRDSLHDPRQLGDALRLRPRHPSQLLEAGTGLLIDCDPDQESPPRECVICSDERQWVPSSGQRWTTAAELAVAGMLARLRPHRLPQRGFWDVTGV